MQRTRDTAPELALRRALHAAGQSKLRRNRERDDETDALLAESGWAVLRAWEQHEPSQDVAARVEHALRELGRAAGQDGRAA